jgi:hypothetical protein
MLPGQGFTRVADQTHSDGRPMLPVVFGVSDGIEADFAHVRESGRSRWSTCMATRVESLVGIRLSRCISHLCAGSPQESQTIDEVKSGGRRSHAVISLRG